MAESRRLLDRYDGLMATRSIVSAEGVVLVQAIVKAGRQFVRRSSLPGPRA